MTRAQQATAILDTAALVPGGETTKQKAIVIVDKAINVLKAAKDSNPRLVKEMKETKVLIEAS